MAQAIAETVFDVFYLSFAIIAGMSMLARGRSPIAKKAGLMATLLGLGDACHLIPRCYALWTTGLEANAAALGTGKFITSITMTIFYLLVYSIWRERYSVKNRNGLTAAMWILAAVRIALCLLPQNEWLSYNPPVFYGVLRNIPFAVMGILIIRIFAERRDDPALRSMPIAVALSFGFYVPVVLFSSAMPAIGALMIPKTLAYVWVVVMCLRLSGAEQARCSEAA